MMRGKQLFFKHISEILQAFFQKFLIVDIDASLCLRDIRLDIRKAVPIARAAGEYPLRNVAHIAGTRKCAASECIDHGLKRWWFLIGQIQTELILQLFERVPFGRNGQVCGKKPWRKDMTDCIDGNSPDSDMIFNVHVKAGKSAQPPAFPQIGFESLFDSVIAQIAGERGTNGVARMKGLKDGMIVGKQQQRDRVVGEH